MKTCKNTIPSEMVTVHNFLYKQTPVYSIWKIRECGWRVGTFWIDDEDLWSGWFPQQHKDKYVKSYSYDEDTLSGVIEIE